MRTLSLCPQPAVWQRLENSQLSAEELEQLCQHLDECSRCGELAADANFVSEMTQMIQASNNGSAAPVDVEVQQLMERLKQHLHTAHKASSGSSTLPSVENTGGSPEGSQVPVEVSSFLSPPQGEDEIGRLGTYRVLRVLGAGGMGVVLQAEDTVLKRLVALKVMKPSIAANAVARQRFLGEARAMAALRHEGVVTVYQAGESDAVAYLAMEYLEGEPLNALLERQPKLPAAEVIRIGRALAEGLAAAHARGLIHRDIKPANIWLECRGEPGATATGGRVKILDFGLARAVTQDVNLTSEGSILGTPAYMSPEQADGRPVDHRTDLFSLGCVLYRMCTGQMPFRGTKPLQVLASLIRDVPVPPQELAPEVPATLSDLVTRLLDKDPAGRPASAREVAEALAALETEPTPGPKVMPRRQVASSPPRSRRRTGILVAASLLGLVGVGLLAQQIIIRITDKEGKTTDIPVPPGGKAEFIDSPLKPIPWGNPLCKQALVTNPALIKGVQSWTVETVGHRAGVKALAFSQKGQWLASGGIDGQVRIWDTSTWKLDRILPGDPVIEYLSWDKDDTLWVVSDKVHHWHPAKGLLLKSFSGGGSAVWFFPNGKQLLIGGTVHDAADGEVFVRIGKIGLPDGKTLATFDKGRVYFWDAQTDKPLRDIPLPEKAGNPIGWAPDAKTFACLREREVLRVDASDGKVLESKTLPKEFNASLIPGTALHERVALTRTDLAVAGSNGSSPGAAILSSKWEKMESVSLWHGTEGGPCPPVWSHDGKMMATASGLAGSIYLFRSGEKEPFRVQAGSGVGSINWLWWNKDGAELVCHGPSSHYPFSFETASGKFLGAQKYFGFPAPNGKLTSGPAGPNLQCWTPITIPPWDAKGFAAMGPLDSPCVFNWSHDSKILLVAYGRKVRLFSTVDGKEIKSLDGGQVAGLTLSPDGKTVALARFDHGSYFLDVDTGKQKGSFGVSEGLPERVAFSLDGKSLGVGTDTLVDIRSADGKELRHTLKQGSRVSSNVSWSPDSKTLATAGDFVRTWDPRTGKVNATLMPGLAVSAQGHYLGTPHEQQRRRGLVYVFRTDQGIETLPPDEFEDRFGWKNDPERVRPTGR